VSARERGRRAAGELHERVLAMIGRDCVLEEEMRVHGTQGSAVGQGALPADTVRLPVGKLDTVRSST